MLDSIVDIPVLMPADLEKQLAQELSKSKTQAREKSSKPRLVADPAIAVSDLMKCIRNFVLFKDCKDLQSLITPSGYRSISWNTAPDGDWLLRMASLAYDLLQIAPNTKIGGKKLTDAIKKLLETGDVTNGSGRDAGKFTDLCSLLIRICLAQFRVLKRDMTKRSIVFRRLEKEDRTRFILIL